MAIKINSLEASASPRDYILDDTLKATVELAIALNKPLLVTGAPGTGKTQLAHKVAYELAENGNSKLKFLRDPWIFNTKTTSTAKDLFYQYDAIGHFQRKGAEKGGEVSVRDYIQLSALGAAIVQTTVGTAFDRTGQLASDKNISEKIRTEQLSSVVLIDEIDKAPRDFPNDLLNEIENYQFYISELNLTIKAAERKDARIVIIMTSNFEKNLPPAFLRRCLFYHIPIPKGDRLMQIVAVRMNAFLQDVGLTLSEAEIKARYQKVVDEFDKWQPMFNDKAPATAELLEWLKALEMYNFFDHQTPFDSLTQEQKCILQYTFPILAKSKEDLEVLEGMTK